MRRGTSSPLPSPRSLHLGSVALGDNNWCFGGVFMSPGLSRSDHLAWDHGYKRWSSCVPRGGERDGGFG